MSEPESIAGSAAPVRSGGELGDIHGSVPVPKGLGFWRKMFVFAGPGFLVAVGYMDPGNWATDIAGGSKFGYELLSIVFLSNLMAILLQALSAKLGIISGRDLAQACSDHYSRPVSVFLWILCELAIAACDLAEVIGSAIALNLLFGMPLLWGVCFTAFDVFLIMYLQNKGFRYMEALVVVVVLIIGVCFGLELYFSKPNAMDVAGGFMPSLSLFKDTEKLYLAIGILGATVMPHNLYLHSSIVQTRRFDSSPAGKREALGFAVFDSTFALIFAFVINAAILIMAASTFHAHGQYDVDDIRVAHQLLTPLLGSAASVIFAVALLASGQNSTLTGTLAGQIVMEGFLNLRMRPWVRRFLTRAIALIPAILVTAYYAKGTTDQQFEAIGRLLVFSQVVLSLQLGFAVIPLIQFTSSRKLMGEFVNSLGTKILAWIAAAIIVVLNIKYVADFIGISKWF
jgi:manganese transport protein